jgi:hypothetical protein
MRAVVNHNETRMTLQKGIEESSERFRPYEDYASENA